MKSGWILLLFLVSIILISILANPVNALPDVIDLTIAFFHLPGLFVCFYYTYFALKKGKFVPLHSLFALIFGFFLNFFFVDYLDLSSVIRLYFVSPFSKLEQVLLLLPFSLLGFIHFGVEEYNLKKKLEQELQQSKQDEQVLREGLLKSQIQPHFLFNALNTIYVMARKNYPETPDSILELSDLLRFTVDSLKQDRISISEEFTFLNQYCSFQKKRISGNLELNTTVEAVDPNFRFPPLLFQPFVENAFNYVEPNSDGAYFIHVTFFQSKQNVFFSCSNSVSIDAQSHWESKETKGLGIQLVKQRLTNYFPDTSSLSISQTNSRFDVTIQLNL